MVKWTSALIFCFLPLWIEYQKNIFVPNKKPMWNFQFYYNKEVRSFESFFGRMGHTDVMWFHVVFDQEICVRRASRILDLWDRAWTPWIFFSLSTHFPFGIVHISPNAGPPLLCHTPSHSGYPPPQRLYVTLYIYKLYSFDVESLNKLLTISMVRNNEVELR